jgi:glycine betaine/proline transport system ATP-binding protein
MTPHLILRNVWKIFGVPEGRQHTPAEAQSIASQSDRNVVVGVNDVSLEIGRGETFVIMGLSGSGKSTLVRCMSRLTEPTAGEILFDGIDLLKASNRQLIDIRRHRMGMVFQHFALLPHLTVAQNVAFPLKIQGVARAKREALAQEVIELVGLKGREYRYPRELSGGQQQRVGIARSLAVQPELWFLDEPFSALDPLIRREMQEELLRLQKILKKTIVFITHDFEEAIRLADRIAIMKDGVVIQVGTPEQILSKPATDYVTAFTKDAPKAKVLSARAIMRPIVPGEAFAGGVRADAKIGELAQMAFRGTGSYVVNDAAGAPIGAVRAADILAVLTDMEPAKAVPNAAGAA